MSNTKYFDSEQDREEAAEKLALIDSAKYGECDVCPAVAVCFDDKSFKCPSDAACMLRKQVYLQSWKELETKGGNKMTTKYIIREEAMSLPVLPKEHRGQLNNVDEAFEEGWRQALKNLANLPAVDAVEIVRCGDFVVLENLKKAHINICKGCKYSYPECPSESQDVLFGNYDNFCACAKFEPYDFCSVMPLTPKEEV